MKTIAIANVLGKSVLQIRGSIAKGPQSHSAQINTWLNQKNR